MRRRRVCVDRSSRIWENQEEFNVLKSTLALVLGAALAVLPPPVARSENASQKPYVVLDKSLGKLRADFNSNVGKVRLLYIVGPTCGICLRGLSDLQESLYSKKGNDPRLITYVVHVPTLGAREVNVAPASRLITNAYTTHYWEETGITGKLMEETLGLTHRYIWDFYAIYGSTAVWSDERPPVPDFYQHQLQGMPPEKRLQADAFAAKVSEFLTQTVPVAKISANAAPKSE
jgi:hypothetical protein